MQYITQLAIAKEEASEMKSAVFLNNIDHIEAQTRLFRNIRHVEGKLKGGRISKVRITKENGEKKDILIRFLLKK